MPAAASSSEPAAGPRRGPDVQTADGLSIATWDLGGVGPELVLTHGTGFHGRCWAPAMEVLGRSFHVWSIDQRGHGRSGHSPDRRYDDWERFAADLLAVVDHLGLGRPSVAGHSLGGAVAILAELQRPGAFRALYAYEPIILPPALVKRLAGAMGLRDLALKRRNQFDSLEAARANYAAKRPFSRFRADALDAYVAGGFVAGPEGTVTLACPGVEEASVYEGAVRHGAFDRLGDLALPVTLVGATVGGDISPEILAELAARMPDVTHHRLDGVSHFGPMEDPDLVASTIVDALS